MHNQSKYFAHYEKNALAADQSSKSASIFICFELHFPSNRKIDRYLVPSHFHWHSQPGNIRNIFVLFPKYCAPCFSMVLF